MKFKYETIVGAEDFNSLFLPKTYKTSSNMENNSAINSPSIKRADGQKWLKFSEILTLTLGAGFLLSGIIFFFAYNWDGLHRFAKMGVVLALLLATFVTVVKVPMRDWVRNITIFAMCVLVGAFLAVYGQVYQTGADSYLLFLSWSLCIVAWVAVADFYPLWLFFMGLVLLTYGLMPFVGYTFTDELVIITVFTAFFEFSPKFIPNKSVAPKWFMSLLFSALSILAVIILSIFIFDGFNRIIGPMGLLVSIAVTAWVCIYAIQNKNLVIYSVFCTGILVLIYELFIKVINDFEAMFFVTFPFMAAVYFLGKHIIDKKKEWETIQVAENMSTDDFNNK